MLTIMRRATPAAGNAAAPDAALPDGAPDAAPNVSPNALPAVLPHAALAAAADPAAADPAAGAAADERWAQAWFALAQHGWATLALVPAAPGLPVRALAERLAECARAYHDGPVHVLDASDAEPGAVAAAAAELVARAAAGQRVLVALPSPLARAAAIPLARAAEAALLVVPLGVASVGETRSAVAAVGRAHFLGSVTVPEA